MSSKSWIVCYSLSWCCLQVLVLRTDACDRQSRPSHCLAESRELYNHSAKCPGFGNHLSAVECSYKLGLLADRLPTVPSCPSSNDFPGKPFDLQWSVYTVTDIDSSQCIPVLNITWRLPQDGSSNFLTGFALHIKYVGLPNPTYVRVFTISSSHPPDLAKTLFHYDCFPLMPGLVQRITLFSLPLSPPSAKLPNHSVMFVRLDQKDDDSSDDHCVRSWIPRVTVVPSLVDATINVSFDPAPDCYHFNAYNVSLVNYNSGSLHVIIERVTLFHPRNSVKLHKLFRDVCPAIIAVMIRPFINETCGCVSLGSSAASSAACHHCTVTSVSPVNMTDSRCKQLAKNIKTTCPPINTATTVIPVNTRPRYEPIPTPDVVGQLAGAAVGVLVAIFLLVLIMIIIYNRRHRNDKDRLIRPMPEPDDSGSTFSSVSTDELQQMIDKINGKYDEDSNSTVLRVYPPSLNSCPTLV